MADLSRRPFIIGNAAYLQKKRTRHRSLKGELGNFRLTYLLQINYTAAVLPISGRLVTMILSNKNLYNYNNKNQMFFKFFFDNNRVPCINKSSSSQNEERACCGYIHFTQTHFCIFYNLLRQRLFVTKLHNMYNLHTLV